MLFQEREYTKFFETERQSVSSIRVISFWNRTILLDKSINRMGFGGMEFRLLSNTNLANLMRKKYLMERLITS